MNLNYHYKRCRELEGSYPGDRYTGVQQITGCRVRKGWGVPAESAWPYIRKDEEWPPLEPPGLDELAKLNRISHYQRASDTHDCKLFLTEGLPVQIALPITEDWHNAPGGLISCPSDLATFVGNHSILLVGVFPETSHFAFINSWGRNWGDNGVGYLPFSYVDTYLLDAWVFHVKGPGCRQEGSSFNTADDIVEIWWTTADPLGGTLCAAELYDQRLNENIGWSFAVLADDGLHLEELFVRPNFRRRGFGMILGNIMKEFGALFSKPLIAWIPGIDCGETGGIEFERVEGTLTAIGLPIIDQSRVPWAKYKAIELQ